MKALFLILLILPPLSSLVLAMDPPAKLWEKWYYNGYDSVSFNDIELTPSGDLFITGNATDWTEPIYKNYCAFLVDQSGGVLWAVEKPFFGIASYDGAVLPDGSFIITGTAVVAQGDSFSLLIMKISSGGAIEWTKVYDYPDTKEEGYGITCLPDGGFAVCGRVHGTGTINAGQLWLLRTDESGDTLWTREWGSTVPNSPDWGKTVLFENNELCVLVHGLTESLPTYGPHLLFYDLEGNYIRGTNYPELYYIFPGDMCLASDSGFIFVTKTFPSISHTDQYGEIMWRHSIEADPNDENEGFCIRRTMDGGYVFSGWDGYFEGPWDDSDSGGNTLDYKEGWLVRFDADGNELWNLNNTVSHDNFFYSCVQLPEGGYITGGTWTGTGYLVRYAPETGIEGGDVIQGITLEAIPNPFSGSLSVSFTLSELVHVNLEVFDLSGRLVQRLLSEEAVPGLHSVEWSPGASVSSGCYLLRLVCAEETVSRRCVLLR
jgi:hypothetical protein